MIMILRVKCFSSPLRIFLFAVPVIPQIPHPRVFILIKSNLQRTAPNGFPLLISV